MSRGISYGSHCIHETRTQVISHITENQRIIITIQRAIHTWGRRRRGRNWVGWRKTIWIKEEDWKEKEEVVEVITKEEINMVLT